MAITIQSAPSITIHRDGSFGVVVQVPEFIQIARGNPDIKRKAVDACTAYLDGPNFFIATTATGKLERDCLRELFSPSADQINSEFDEAAAAQMAMGM
jgi:hypothetical protein